MNASYTRFDKYRLTAKLLTKATGALVDVGARDQILHRYLPPSIIYSAADLTVGNNLQWDLNKPIACTDGAYDYVTALDVVEHVDALHQACRELLRIARKKVYLSLPNMANIIHRWSFFRHGLFTDTDKYRLIERPSGARHCWLTTYTEILGLITTIAAQENNCTVTQYNILNSGTLPEKIFSALPLPPAWRTTTVYFEITKPTHETARH